MSARAPREHEAYVGLGSNLGDRGAALRAAVGAFGSAVEAVSSFVETEPWGILDQPWFLNAVVLLRWTESPRALLLRCLVIEEQLGRVRAQRNGPRTIDLDVLLVGAAVVDEPGLTVPHPGLGTRRSVLEPFAALAPDLVVPGLHVTLAELRARAEMLPGQRVHRGGSVQSSLGEKASPSASLASPLLEE